MFICSAFFLLTLHSQILLFCFTSMLSIFVQFFTLLIFSLQYFIILKEILSALYGHIVNLNKHTMCTRTKCVYCSFLGVVFHKYPWGQGVSYWPDHFCTYCLCLIFLLIAEIKVFKSSTIIVELSVFLLILSLFASCILKHCYLVHTHLWLLCLLDKLTLYHYEVSLFISDNILCLVLSYINIATLTFSGSLLSISDAITDMVEFWSILSLLVFLLSPVFCCCSFAGPFLPSLEISKYFSELYLIFLSF